jgi:hypothetical protein
MKNVIRRRIPDGETFASLTPAELGGLMLEEMCGFTAQDSGQLQLRSFTGLFTGRSRESPYPEQHWDAINGAVSEAWAWLIAQGFIARHHEGGEHGWIFITRQGRKAGSEKGVLEFRKALPP